jgi:drug/metabolite transporter (DMT)-like permease
MKSISLHIKAALISSLSFSISSFFFGLFIDPRMEFPLYAFLIEFIFLFPLYLLIGNPITYLSRLFIKKVTDRFYYPLLILFISITAFIIMYILSLYNGIGLRSSLTDDFIQLILFTLIVAFSSIFGVEVSDKA